MRHREALRLVVIGHSLLALVVEAFIFAAAAGGTWSQTTLNKGAVNWGILHDFTSGQVDGFVSGAYTASVLKSSGQAISACLVLAAFAIGISVIASWVIWPFQKLPFESRSYLFIPAVAAPVFLFIAWLLWTAVSQSYINSDFGIEADVSWCFALCVLASVLSCVDILLVAAVRYYMAPPASSESEDLVPASTADGAAPSRTQLIYGTTSV